MEDTKIKFSALWTALMLSYQQGDVMRLYSGDFMPGGAINGVQATQMMWLDEYHDVARAIKLWIDGHTRGKTIKL